jgi:DNA replication and repair protein RecF
MILRKLELIDFRSHKQLLLEFAPGANLLIGSNGAGKTNIIEAIGYLASLKSHRVSQDSMLINKESACSYVRGLVERDGREILLELEINNGKSNRARINQAAQPKERDLLGYLQRILFAPEDLELVKGDPSTRRDYLDTLLVAKSPRLAGVISDYDRALKQRNSLLKTAQSRNFDENTLDVWDEKLVERGSELVYERLQLVNDLTAPFVTEYAAVAPEGIVSLKYRTSLLENEIADLSTTHEELAIAMMAVIKKERKREIERGISLVGPHRDELVLLLDSEVAKGFASHGESWSIALALKLAAYDLLEADEPILILDDVFAELDGKRRDALTAQLLHKGRTRQLFITAAVVEDVPEEFRSNVIQVGESND